MPNDVANLDPFEQWMRRLLPSQGDPHSDGTPAPDATPIEDPAPTSVGRYTIRGELARGGMGVVYRAHDPALGRDIALKYMHGWSRVFASSGQRFLDEARITGQLQHPGIPPVHEIGELPDGSPFLVMKLIKGHTLAELLKDRPDPTADRGLYLAIFEKVCDAVGYAHAHGVIHRDLKPANVMVGAFGEVQVMDWGLAKVLGQPTAQQVRPSGEETVGTQIRSLRDTDGSETEAGSMLGTPAYMPPEQAGGEREKIDARADVFGLGAILVVLLTGQPPYVAEDGEDVRLMAVRGQLTGCLMRLETCGAEPELVELCRQCLSFAPKDRPVDAGAVATAVQRFRAEAEERARRAEIDRGRAEEKAAEQRKRRRVQVALLGAVGVIVLGVGAAAWWQDKQTTTRRAEAKRNAEALAALLTVGEEALRTGDTGKAQTAFDEAARRVDATIGDDLQTRLANGQSELAALRELDAIDQFRWTPAVFTTVDDRALLPRWRAAFGMIGADPSTVPTQDVAKRVLGSPIQDRLIAALDQWLSVGRSAEVRAVLQAVDPDAFRGGLRDRVLAGDVAGVAAWAAKPESLNQPAGFVVVLGLETAVPPQRRRELLRAVVRQQPGNLTVLMTLGRTYPINQREGANDRLRWFQAAVGIAPTNPTTHHQLGLALYDTGDLVGAVAVFRDTIRLDSQIAIAHNNLGLALMDRGELDEALAAIREAIRINPKLAGAHNNLGTALEKKGDLPGAIASYTEATRLHPNYAIAFTNLGMALYRTRQYDNAIVALREAIRLNPLIGTAHNSLGNALRDTGDPDGAIKEYQEAMRLDPKDAMPHNNLAVVYFNRRDLDGAVREFQEATRLDPKFARGFTNLGIGLRAKGDIDGAIRAYTEAIRLDPKESAAYGNLGLILYRRGDLAGMIAVFEDAVRRDPTNPRHRNDLAWPLATGPDQLRDGKQAVEHATKACELTEWKNPRYLNTLAAAYAEVGDFAKAIEYQKKSLSFPAFEQSAGATAREQLALYTRKLPYRDPTMASRELAPPPRAK